jgi:hypothetical protein
MSLKESLTERSPPLCGENYIFALLLRMVQEHCGTMNVGEIDSYAIEANADAMTALADAGFIEIVGQADGRMRATVLPKGEALAARFLAEKNAGRSKSYNVGKSTISRLSA